MSSYVAMLAEGLVAREPFNDVSFLYMFPQAEKVVGSFHCREGHYHIETTLAEYIVVDFDKRILKMLYGTLPYIPQSCEFH